MDSYFNFPRNGFLPHSKIKEFFDFFYFLDQRSTSAKNELSKMLVDSVLFALKNRR